MAVASAKVPINDPHGAEIASPTGRPSQRGEWTWELVTQFPRQGEWTEESYLARDFEGLVEFVDGKLEFLPMVTPFHQDLQMFLYRLLLSATYQRHPGTIYLAPLRLYVDGSRYREPDIVLVRPEHIPHRKRPVIGADLVMEVVSGSKDDRDRDFIEKRKDYAQARIPEYWIVDPETETITVLTLPDGATEYVVHGEFKPAQTATSKLLDGFTVDVTACFAAGKGPHP